MQRERVGWRVVALLVLLVGVVTATTVAQEARIVGWFPLAGATVKDFRVTEQLAVGEVIGVPGVNPADLTGTPRLIVRNIEGLKNRDDNGDGDANTPGPLVLNAASPEPVRVVSPLLVGPLDDPTTPADEEFVPPDEDPATPELDLSEDSIYVAGKIETDQIFIGPQDAGTRAQAAASGSGVFISGDLFVNEKPLVPFVQVSGLVRNYRYDAEWRGGAADTDEIMTDGLNVGRIGDENVHQFSRFIPIEGNSTGPTSDAGAFSYLVRQWFTFDDPDTPANDPGLGVPIEGPDQVLSVFAAHGGDRHWSRTSHRQSGDVWVLPVAPGDIRRRNPAAPEGATNPTGFVLRWQVWGDNIQMTVNWYAMVKPGEN